jgi:hypothetical protein
MPGSKSMLRKGPVEVDTVFRIGSKQEERRLVHDPLLMEESHVHRRLTGKLQRRIAEGLLALA